MASSVAARRSLALLLLVIAVSVTVAGAAGSRSFTVINNCSYTVWPGILSGAGSTAVLDNTGFELAPGDSRAVPVPPGWSGPIWGCTFCSTDAGTGIFTCVTGDCSSGKQDCAGGGPAPPATLAQFTLDGSDGMDFYDVSLVDGYNLPMLVAPQGGNCAPTGCVADLNGGCPTELRVITSPAAAAVACKNACLAFGSPQYCCTGPEYGNPNTCKPSAYSQWFKSACPQASTYAFDGADSIFTCGGGRGYSITFCPSTNSAKPSTSHDSQSQPPVTGNLPHINGTMPYAGGSQVGVPTAASPPWTIIIGLVSAVLGLVTAILGVVALFKKCSKQRAGE